MGLLEDLQVRQQQGGMRYASWVLDAWARSYGLAAAYREATAEQALHVVGTSIIAAYCALAGTSPGALHGAGHHRHGQVRGPHRGGLEEVSA